MTAVSSLEGPPILLCLSAKRDASADPGRQLQRLLKIAGAQTIVEHVSHRITAGRQETALARVFMVSLFGNH